VDAHDRVLDANTVAEKWLGRSKDELIGRDPMEIFRQWPEFLRRFLSTQETREEVRIPGKTPRMLEIMVTPLYDPISKELNGRVILAYDVTARKQLENDLTETNEILWTKIAEIDSLREQLQEQAIRDDLTRVFNRRFLTETLDKEIPRAERERTPISVVMIDVDQFKKFNDTHGHKCGDLVLKHLADFLIAQARASDIVCRFGGEEFVILMPNATHEDAYERAESWRQAYAEKPFHFDGQVLHTTFSGGVASYPAHGLGGDEILNAADHALYHSKSQGRNRVTLYSNGASGDNHHAN
ncbi:MAG: diguanylate cyclase, partial [bacterium]